MSRFRDFCADKQTDRTNYFTPSTCAQCNDCTGKPHITTYNSDSYVHTTVTATLVPSVEIICNNYYGLHAVITLIFQTPDQLTKLIFTFYFTLYVCQVHSKFFKSTLITVICLTHQMVGLRWSQKLKIWQVLSTTKWQTNGRWLESSWKFLKENSHTLQTSIVTPTAASSRC